MKLSEEIRILKLKSKIDIRENINSEDIKECSLYRVSQVCDLLWITKRTVAFHCDNWNLEYHNIWKGQYKVRLITWESIIEFINNRKWNK